MEKIIRCLDFTMRASETEDMTVEGYALKFDKETIIGSAKWGFREKISRTALDGAKLDDVAFDFNHSFNDMLAGTKNRSLILTNDGTGLKVDAKIVDTAIGRDVYKLIKDGLINRMSFIATIKNAIWTTSEDDDELDIREITSFDRFYDVSAVTFPAYEDTPLIARSDIKLFDADIVRHFESKQNYESQIKRLNQILEREKV